MGLGGVPSIPVFQSLWGISAAGLWTPRDPFLHLLPCKKAALFSMCIVSLKIGERVLAFLGTVSRPGMEGERQPEPDAAPRCDVCHCANPGGDALWQKLSGCQGPLIVPELGGHAWI